MCKYRKLFVSPQKLSKEVVCLAVASSSLKALTRGSLRVLILGAITITVFPQADELESPTLDSWSRRRPLLSLKKYQFYISKYVVSNTECICPPTLQ